MEDVLEIIILALISVLLILTLNINDKVNKLEKTCNNIHTTNQVEKEDK